MPPKTPRHLYTRTTLTILAVVAVALYGATLMRFGVMMGGGP
ncbi:MAG: hypothetical protein ACM3Q1_02590 [Bacteroidales bacterium]